MRYLVTINGNQEDKGVIAEDHGTYVSFDHGIETIHKTTFETAAQAIRREYPNCLIYPLRTESASTYTALDGLVNGDGQPLNYRKGK